MGLASINIRFKADLTGFSTEMQNVSRKMQSLGTKMNDLGKSMSLYVTGPLLAGGAAAIKFASDYEESLNKVNVAFGTSAASVRDFAKQTLETSGIAEGSALDMAAQFGDMSTSMGLSQSAAAQMSISVVKLAGDLASFKNIGIEQANTALAGIWTGETESLKKLGIVMTEANLQAFALSKGIKTQVKDMDQASKVNLRYAYIMANTTNAQGDFVRTGGGAANQSRVFTESLKQLAQQFGSVILPAFTKLITFVNGLIKGFGNLSPETKKMIVVVAGFAAAIGPLMVGLGNLIGIIPRLIVQFNALKATAIANPYMALATAILAVGAAIYVMVNSSSQFTNAQKEFTEVTKKVSDSVARESAELEKNLAIAKNKSLSDAARKKAIENINAISPEFLGNISLETLYTKESTEALKKYNAEALKRATVQAAEKKLVEVREKLLDLELGNQESVQPTLWQNLANSLKAAATGNGLYASEGLKAITVAKNQQKETSELTKLQEKLLKVISGFGSKETEEDFETVITGLKAIKDTTTQLLPGTIAFYQAQISEIKKIQSGVAKTNSEWEIYEKRIESIQKKIDAIEGKVKLPKPELPNSIENETPPVYTLNLADYERQIQRYRELQSQFSDDTDKGKAAFQRYEELINDTQLKINEIKGVKENSEILKKYSEDAAKEAERVAALVEGFNQNLTASINSALGSFAEGFGQIIGRFASGGNVLQNIGSLFLGTLAGLMEQVGKIAIQTGLAILGIKAALKSLNPALAIGAGVALIALSSLIKAQMSSAGGGGIPGFADGGITGGTSYYGDKILARINSGELIANPAQQKAIWGAMSGSSATDININGNWEVSGDKLQLVLDRNSKKKDRTG